LYYPFHLFCLRTFLRFFFFLLYIYSELNFSMSNTGRLILIFLLFSVSLLNGQELPFKNYTVKGGYILPSNCFYDIAQDKEGYIWLATVSGLVKFDGYNFRTYTTRDGLADNSISALLVDKSGKLWIGTDNGGISILSRGKFKNITTENGLTSNSIGKLFEDKQGNIWALGYGGGASLINADTIISFNAENSALSSDINCYVPDKKGNIYFGNYDGLFIYNSKTKHIEPVKIKDCKLIWDLGIDEYERVWIATQENGLFCYNPDTVLHYSTRNGLSSNRILSVMVSKSGKIYIGTVDGGIDVIENSGVSLVFRGKENPEVWKLIEDSRGRIWGNTRGSGLVMVENSILKFISKSNLLVDDNVNTMFEDNNNNLWFATQNGLSKLGKTLFETYTSGFIGNDKKVLSVYAADDGKIYAGTYAGLNYYSKNDTIIRNFSLSVLPTDPAVISIAGNKKSGIMLGTSGGLTFLNGNKRYFPVRESIDTIPEDYYNLSLVEKSGVVYAATYYGLLVFENNHYKLFTVAEGLSDNKINCVAIDKNGLLWCGTANGLSIFDGKIFYNYTVKNGLSDNICNDIAFDDKGVVWIATEFGVTSAVLDKSYNFSTRKYTMKDGLGSNTIFSILVDGRQQVWIGHNRGVDRLDPRTKSIKNYTSLDGFLPVENLLGAIDIDKENNIWFGTVEGLVKYNPSNEIKNSLPPKIYITGVYLHNDTSSLRRYYTKVDSVTFLPIDLKLKYRKRNLYFSYVGLHYTEVEKNQYKYRLLGYDNNWSEPTNDIVSVPFQRIPPGKYVFQVMAANCDGVWSDKPAEFSFQILPPFWNTWWARILEVLLLIGAFYLIIYLRERKLRYDKKILQQKVTERTIEIEKQKDHIAIQRDKIAHQKQEITDSIEYARHIQSAILPKDETIAPLLKDYFILYKPRDIVSGDFYWISSYGQKTIAIAADCTGHGVPGAFMSMLGVSTLNEITSNLPNLKPGEILDILREHIISTLSHTGGGDQARDGMDISMCVFDFDASSVEFAGAFNPLVLIRNKEEIVYKADKMPVGLHIGEIQSFTTTKIELQKNDCVYMFSDGYADQFGGPEGKKFKSANFRALLCEISDKPITEQRELLDSAIITWMHGQEQIDDILVMGIKI
jgi:ligand-binding sensor domain-containing protein/serine phosphatase RsbU (regulator of sigma subunit)